MTDTTAANRSVVWEEGERSRYPHFVYALHESTAGTILAYCEARIGRGDADPHDLVLKRGTGGDDGALRWGQNIIIDNGDVDGGLCWANPTAITDRRTGRLLVLYALNDGSRNQSTSRVFVRLSDDDGQSWSARTELTSLFDEAPHRWTFHFPGPGHGIQLSRQPSTRLNGRLVVQFWHRRALSSEPRSYGASVIFSDDGGDTWQTGGHCGVGMNMNESRLVELGDGTIVLNARGSKDGGLDNRHERITSHSVDGGVSFAAPQQRGSLRHTPCDAGLVRVDHEGRELLIYSHPGRMDTRDELTISISDDLGRSWIGSHVVDAERAWYSDLVLRSNGRVGVLWGQGRPCKVHDGWGPARVVYQEYGLDALLSLCQRQGRQPTAVSGRRTTGGHASREAGSAPSGPTLTCRAPN